MKIKKVLLALFIFYSTMAYCKNDFVVKKIRIEGVQRISENTILFNMPISVGDIVDRKNISQTINKLFSTQNFEDIKILRDKDTLIVKVKERPIITSISFFGNKVINTEILQKYLDTKGISTGKFISHANISNIKKILLNFFYELGRYNAKIKVIVTELPYNCIDIKLIFNEAESAKIRQINILGNHDFTVDELLSNFQLCNVDSWWNILSNKEYQQKKLLNDLKSLYEFYLNRGYIKFNIDSIQVESTLDKKAVYITLNITEGAKYKLDNIIVYNDVTVDSYVKEIKQLINITPNEFYKKSKISKIENDINKTLGNYGYAFPNIEIRSEIDDIHHKINLYINISTGKRFYVRYIRFEGNYITKDSVLRREIKQMEGTWFNKNLIIQSNDRLNRLGYFKSVETQIEPVSGIPDQIDLIYKVKENNTGNINLGVGLGTESGINFQLKIQQSNWLGTGNSVNINSVKNNYQAYTELSINNPYFGIDGINLGGKLFYNNIVSDNTNLSNYNLKSFGTGIILNIPIINDNYSLNLGLDYIHNNLTDIQPQVVIWRYLKSNNINYQKTINIENVNKNISFYANDVLLTLSLISSNLDQNRFPKSGYRNIISIKSTTPYSDNKYYKIILNSSNYVPLGKNTNFILVGHAKIGYSGGLNNKETPFYDNFYAGGFNTVRGFKFNTIGPKAAYYKCNFNEKNNEICSMNKSEDSVGGNAMVITSTELILPIPFLNKKYDNLIRTLLFFDAGTVLDTYWINNNITRAANIPDYSKYSNIRFSSGIAVQWMSPLGPLSLSYARPLKKYTGDKLEQFQFSIGKTW